MRERIVTPEMIAQQQRDLDSSFASLRQTALRVASERSLYRAALLRLLDVCERMDLDNAGDRPTEDDYQAAMEWARSALKESDRAS